MPLCPKNISTPRVDNLVDIVDYLCILSPNTLQKVDNSVDK